MDVSDWKTSLLVIGLKSLSLRRDYVVIGVSTVSEPTNQYQRTVIPVTVTYAVIIQKAALLKSYSLDIFLSETAG